MSTKASKTLIIAASQGATSLSKTLKQTTAATSPTAREDGHKEFIAAGQGATSSSKTLKQTMSSQQPSLVAMAATSTTTRDNGRRALVAAGGHGSFILETLKQTKAPRTVVEPIWEESGAFSSVPILTK